MQAAIDEDSVETNEILILKDFKIAIRFDKYWKKQYP